ncbi:MAG: RNA polymerase subunit sigma [Flammeovirgaceae bacterium]|nr:RNA polymerase subunit sigma [Flammeovirgaceae bacterium]
MNTAQAITTYQPMLQVIAYNLVRCKADAEDIVQETFLKWLSLGPQKVQNTKAYLIKAVTNNCLNHLQSLKKKKEEYLDSIHISEFINKVKETNFSHLDFDVNLKAAFKILHTKLEPLERTVFLLKEAFDFDYDALQVELNKKKDHLRQLVCRAKKKLSEETAKIHVDFPDASTLFENFRKAFDKGTPAELIQAFKGDSIEN